MEKITLKIFTDPMMGLSYESEPFIRALETHFPDRIIIQPVMSVLVDDVYRFVNQIELREHGKDYALSQYLPRLAQIYRDEERISGLPIRMQGFRLFDAEHTSTLHLNLAYKAVERIAPELAEQFLYRMRFAIIAQTRPLLETVELEGLVGQLGIGLDKFREALDDPATRQALEADLAFKASLGVRALPSYLFEYGHRRLLASGVLNFSTMVDTIEQVSDGKLQPVAPSPTEESVGELLKRHPLISYAELEHAYRLDRLGVKNLLKPFVESGLVVPVQGLEEFFVRASI